LTWSDFLLGLVGIRRAREKSRASAGF